MFVEGLGALPIEEPSANAYQSETPGVMHACGHDAHAAIGLGVAVVLSRLPQLTGRVRLRFKGSSQQCLV